MIAAYEVTVICNEKLVGCNLTQVGLFCNYVYKLPNYRLNFTNIRVYIFQMIVANTPVRVATNTKTEVQVYLKLQLRRYNGTLTFT